MVALPLALAAPASAKITEGPCDGSVTIQGVTYTPANDTPGNPAVIPNESGVIVDYTGNTGGVVIKDHSGSISIHVGPIPIEVATWAGENADELVEKTDTYPLDQAYEALPFDVVGIYRVSGEHSGEGGACAGFAYVRIEGNPITTVPGAAATAVTVAAAGGVVGAAFAKKPKASR
jgi:hypothetical protein